MGRQPEAAGLSELKSAAADPDRKLNEEQRTVQERGSGLSSNLTDYGATTHDISKGDTVAVATYPSGIFIRKVEDE